MDKVALYDELFQRLDSLCADETDEIALMATIACEWFHLVPYVQWAGFYRVIAKDVLKVGPYQGGHGCLTIPFARGICGRCARERVLLNIPDVHAETDHIACSSSTLSELVVPICDASGAVMAVLDCDSDTAAAFDRLDEEAGLRVAGYFAR